MHYVPQIKICINDTWKFVMPTLLSPNSFQLHYNYGSGSSRYLLHIHLLHIHTIHINIALIELHSLLNILNRPSSLSSSELNRIMSKVFL